MYLALVFRCPAKWLCYREFVATCSVMNGILTPPSTSPPSALAATFLGAIVDDVDWRRKIKCCCVEMYVQADALLKLHQGKSSLEWWNDEGRYEEVGN